MNEDEVQYEEVPPFLGQGILIGLLALLTNSAIFAMLAVVTMVVSFYIEWKVSRFDWNFGLENEGVDDEIREA